MTAPVRPAVLRPPLRVCELARADCVRAVLRLEFGLDPGQRRPLESEAVDIVTTWLIVVRKERPPEGCDDREARGKWLIGRILEYCQNRIDASEVTS